MAIASFERRGFMQPVGLLVFITYLVCTGKDTAGNAGLTRVFVDSPLPLAQGARVAAMNRQAKFKRRKVASHRNGLTLA